ncbi:DUF6626 family protein [Fulvimarina sp. 2208YS6-2-32]|uniref:DUF6626 family protein n=1 Tax=Fulvimarina uroteuthidis TaxID=3098149 RepID=A0ABU5I6E6_9HYPH|nr:DUF6626 family protein [Fulvimarina sp. 2208YS6-2-32]MDY8110786.1 DUF6626 family protein [Fulvimarina sp. 2208YS6-2-32]
MIHHVYQRLRDGGFTHSQVHFSTVWLGRSSRYYSNLIATQREPAIGTMLELNTRVLRVALHMERGQNAHELLELVGQLDEEMFRRISYRVTLTRLKVETEKVGPTSL